MGELGSQRKKQPDDHCLSAGAIISPRLAELAEAERSEVSGRYK